MGKFLYVQKTFYVFFDTKTERVQKQILGGKFWSWVWQLLGQAVKWEKLLGQPIDWKELLTHGAASVGSHCVVPHVPPVLSAPHEARASSVSLASSIPFVAGLTAPPNPPH
jgi:hypothetical protein